MTENRLFAGWLRSITALAAVAGTLGLSACGGGSGAPNNPFLGPLTVLPAAVVAYSGVPTTLTISGGTGPYKVFSSNPTVLPVTQTVPATTVVLLANNVAADTEVTITIQETGTVTPVGAQVPVTVTVRTAALGNSLTITPGLDCGTNAICSGQNGTASVTVPFAGRSVRFDVIGTTYAIVSNNPAQPLVPSLTVISDANGVASVIIQANAGIPTQFAQLRVTDLTSGQQLIGNFLIQQGIDGSTIISVVPATVTFTGPDSATCSSGLTADYFIYGGTPPYRVTSTFPAFVTLVNSIVNVAGGSFRAITNGSCVDPLNFSIVDAAGLQTTAKLINKAGSGDPPVVSPAVAISPPSYTSAACTGASFSFTISGGTPPFSVASAGGAVLPNPVTTTPGSVTISGFLTGSGAHPVLVGDSAIPQRTTSATITCT
jgi:hypothetical protein